MKIHGTRANLRLLVMYPVSHIYEEVSDKIFDGFGKTIISANEAHTNLNLFVMHSICEPP